MKNLLVLSLALNLSLVMRVYFNGEKHGFWFNVEHQEEGQKKDADMENPASERTRFHSFQLMVKKLWNSSTSQTRNAASTWQRENECDQLVIGLYACRIIIQSDAVCIHLFYHRVFLNEIYRKLDLNILLNKIDYKNESWDVSLERPRQLFPCLLPLGDQYGRLPNFPMHPFLSSTLLCLCERYNNSVLRDHIQ